MARRYLTEKELIELAENISDIDENQDNLGGFGESSDDLSDNESEHSVHDSDSEIELEILDEIEEGGNVGDENASDCEVVGQTGNYYYGKNRYKWAKNAPQKSVRRPAHNLVMHLPGLKGRAQVTNPSTPYEAWQLLFIEDILTIILEHTNAKISEVSFNYQVDRVSFVDHLGLAELKAFLGLIYLAGIFKSGREDTASLFSTDGTGRPIFRATMSEKRFLFLLSALRFDDVASRRDRINEGDKLAAVSEIFNMLVNACQDNYTCSEHATVDEMLVAFRGRCSFRMFMKSKPAKYGLKIMCLCDSKSHYLLNAFVYTGKSSRRQPGSFSVPTLDVLKLVKPIENTNRNVTGDNWFTSIELINELKSRGLTYVGTVKKNKREVPPQFLPNKQRKANTSIFGFTRDHTLVSYVPKKYRSAILLSSMHHSDEIDPESQKPEIIEFYNATKSGVDSLDQKCASYSCGRRTRRWPLAIFYAMLNIARVNSYVILKAANPGFKMTRREHGISLGKALINDHLMDRIQNKKLPKNIRQSIAEILKIPVPSAEEPARPQPKRQRCFYCPRAKDQKYLTRCSTCTKTVCKEHSIQQIQCGSCNDDQNNM